MSRRHVVACSIAAILRADRLTQAPAPATPSVMARQAGRGQDRRRRDRRRHPGPAPMRRLDPASVLTPGRQLGHMTALPRRAGHGASYRTETSQQDRLRPAAHRGMEPEPRSAQHRQRAGRAKARACATGADRLSRSSERPRCGLAPGARGIMGNGITETGSSQAASVLAQTHERRRRPAAAV